MNEFLLTDEELEDLTLAVRISIPEAKEISKAQAKKLIKWLSKHNDSQGRILILDREDWQTLNKDS